MSAVESRRRRKARRQRWQWVPSTDLGWWALVLGLLFLAWIPFSDAIPVGGGLIVPLGLVAGTLALVALRRGDRAVLAMTPLVAGLVALAFVLADFASG